MIHLSAVKHAARFSCRPTFSLFSCNSKGEYKLLSIHTSPQSVVEAFEQACHSAFGLEIRCDGVRVPL